MLVPEREQPSPDYVWGELPWWVPGPAGDFVCDREIKTVVLSHWDFRAYLSLQKSLRTQWVSFILQKSFY